MDDHAIARFGLVSLLETEEGLEVVGQAEDGESAIVRAEELKPNVVIMDLVMPGMDGVAATRAISERLPQTKILVLTTFGDSDDIAHALEAGATGALMKNTGINELIDAIRSVAAGRQVLAPEIRKMLAENPPVPELTPRQMEILHSVTRGLTNRDIAVRFGISPISVKKHLTVIFAKLGAATRAEAVAIALRKHLLKP